MKKAFTLVEILIVVAILGIMAAIVIPTFRGHIQEAKEAAAKDSLRILRNAIELYASQHNNVPPGYTNDNPAMNLSSNTFYIQIVFKGKYLSKLPENPINGDVRVILVKNSGTFPAQADGLTGWIYQPATKTIRVNSPGTDSKGVRYYDY